MSASYKIKRYLTEMAKRRKEPTPEELERQEARLHELERRKAKIEVREHAEKQEERVKAIIFGGDFKAKAQLDPDYRAEEEIIDLDYAFAKRFGKPIITPRMVLESYTFHDNSNIFDRPMDGITDEEILMRLTEYFLDPMTRFVARWIEKDELHSMEFTLVRVT